MSNFSKLGKNDAVLVEHTAYGRREIFPGLVIKTTKTRVTVQCEQREITFTLNDGRQYPRPTGWNGGMTLLEDTPDNHLAYRRSAYMRRIKNRTFVLSKVSDSALEMLSEDQLAKMAHHLYESLADVRANSSSERKVGENK